MKTSPRTNRETHLKKSPHGAQQRSSATRKNSPNFRPILTDTAIKNAKAHPDKDVRLADASGLFLVVTASGGKLFRGCVYLHGRQIMVSFGRYPETSLADAREALLHAKKLVTQGINPNIAKKEAAQEACRASIKDAKCVFSVVCEEWQKATSRKIKSSSALQRAREIKKDLLPAFGSLRAPRFPDDKTIVTKFALDGHASPNPDAIVPRVQVTQRGPCAVGLVPPRTAGCVRDSPRPCVHYRLHRCSVAICLTMRKILKEGFTFEICHHFFPIRGKTLADRH